MFALPQQISSSPLYCWFGSLTKHRARRLEPLDEAAVASLAGFFIIVVEEVVEEEQVVAGLINFESAAAEGCFIIDDDEWG